MNKPSMVLPLVLAASFPFFGACQQRPTQADEKAGQGDEQTLRQEIADAATTARIKTAFLFNRHLNSFRINVDTEDGHVTLQGVVKSGIEKDLAGEIAKNAEGVKSLDNELKVGEGPISEPEEVDRTFSQAVIDATTTASVKTALAVARGVHAHEIDVSTRWGTVTLEGAVQTRAEKELADRVARETAGVKEVENKIRVQG